MRYMCVSVPYVMSLLHRHSSWSILGYVSFVSCCYLIVYLTNVSIPWWTGLLPLVYLIGDAPVACIVVLVAHFQSPAQTSCCWAWSIHALDSCASALSFDFTAFCFIISHHCPIDTHVWLWAKNTCPVCHSCLSSNTASHVPLVAHVYHAHHQAMCSQLVCWVYQ